MTGNFTKILFLHLLVSITFGQVLFKEDFADTTDANVKMLTDSLNYKFHTETAGSIEIKDYDSGVIFKLDDNIADGSTYEKIYVSFCLKNLSQSVKEKFAGLVFYNNSQEIFGLGNDYFSENYSFWKTGGDGVNLGQSPVRVDSDIHKIVMEIKFNPAGPEEIKIAFDPFCNRSMERQPQHIWCETEYEFTFDEFRLRCGNTDCVWQFDEVIIGTEWQDVTASDDDPGAYIQTIKSNMSAYADSETIDDGVYRFWQKYGDAGKAAKSFVMQKDYISMGPIDSGLDIEPAFATIGDKRYVYLDIDSETDLYGTGEVTGGLIRNGYKIVLFNKDCYSYNKPDQLYQSHPWVLGVRQDGTAFGVIFDSTWKSELDLRSGILFSVPSDALAFPVIIIDGKSPQEVLLRLAKLTGTMQMPPKWSLGYQQCRYSYYPEARVREIVDCFRAKQIPCDVIWFDIDYMDGFRIFTFNEKDFPDPEATNDYLHSMGFKSVWMIDPGVKNDPNYFVYQSGTTQDAWVKDASGGYFVGPVWPGDCVFPDFTVPAVRTWWAKLYKDFMAKGIDGVWNDMNEPSVFEDALQGTMAEDAVHAGGQDLLPGRHIQYHNVYGLLMVKASREGILDANPDKRPFVLSRANFLGGHKYAATWTGDNVATWDHMKMSIPMSLNLSMSGQPFNGPDIGGFVGNATADLWAHWISVGAYFPFSRAHSAKGTKDQEPWSFGIATENAARTALEQRYRLMPYLYTLFRQANQTGMPVMRPVFFADPADISLRNEQQAFLLGTDLMIIPQWAKDVKLPDSKWRDISITSCPKDAYQCQLKVKAGAILPVGPVVQTTEQLNMDSALSLIIVPDASGNAAGSLYEDEGDGFGYMDNEYRVSSFKAVTNSDGTMTVNVEQSGKFAAEKRLVSVTVYTDKGVYHSFGDICKGVKVFLTGQIENPDIRYEEEDWSM